LVRPDSGFGGPGDFDRRGRGSRSRDLWGTGSKNADSLGDSSCVKKPVYSWSRVVFQNVDRRVEGHEILGVVEFSR
jgi:hypothetical protein